MNQRPDFIHWNPTTVPKFIRTTCAVFCLLAIALALITIPCSATADTQDVSADEGLAGDSPAANSTAESTTLITETPTVVPTDEVTAEPTTEVTTNPREALSENQAAETVETGESVGNSAIGPTVMTEPVVTVTIGPIPPIRPLADFGSTPIRGSVPLTVAFTDLSKGKVNGWAWYFGDETYDQAWTRQTTQALWTARTAHTSVALLDGSIVLMGGTNYKVLYNDMWLSTDKGQTWKQQTAKAEWSPREGQSAVVLQDGSIVLMGGRDDSQSYNTVWRSTDKGKTWTVRKANPGWKERFDFSSVVLPDNSIVIMGGGQNNEQLLNDVWRSDDYGLTWKQQTAKAEWSPREGQSAVAMPNGSIVLMGGGDYSSNPFNDVWISTDKGKTWKQQTAKAEWSPRERQSAVAMPDGSIVLMGGGDYVTLFNDIWRSRDNGISWTQLNANADWTKRQGQSAVATPDGSIVLMGGYGSESTVASLNDVWRMETAGSSVQNPTHTYTTEGNYSVALQVSNAVVYNSTLKNQYISVSEDHAVHWVLDTTPPTPPDTFNVYYGMPPSDRFSEGYISKIADSMGITANDPGDSSNVSLGEGPDFRGLYVKPDNIELLIHKQSNAILMHNYDKWYNVSSYNASTSGNGVALPSDNEAYQIARLHISHISANIPGGDQVDYTNKNIHRDNKIIDESGNILWQDVSVSFGRTPVDGYPVFGDTMSVEIGTDRQVISVFTNWRNWTKNSTEYAKSVPFSPDGFERFKHAGVRPRNMPSDYWMEARNLTVVVDSVKIAWYSPPPAEADEAYLQPVYVVSGHVIADGRTDAFIPVDVPATAQNYVAMPGLEADVISADTAGAYSSGAGSADILAQVPQAASRISAESPPPSGNSVGSDNPDENAESDEDRPNRVYGAAPSKYYDPLNATFNSSTGLCNDMDSHRDMCASIPSIDGFMYTLVDGTKSTDKSGTTTYVWENVTPLDIIANASPDKWIDPDPKYSGILVDGKKYQGNDTQYADKADFAYYLGHGNAGEISFSNLSFETFPSIDPRTYFLHLTNASIYLGNTNARYVVFDSCNTLNLSGTRRDGSAWGWEGWESSFGPKLRMILSFDTESRISQHRGTYFAQRMVGVLNNPDYTGKATIMQSWWDATDLTEEADHVPAIIYRGTTDTDTLPTLRGWAYGKRGTTFYWVGHKVPGVNQT
jgi:PKD repeat protein